jgi:hypothetical protein
MVGEIWILRESAFREHPPYYASEQGRVAGAPTRCGEAATRMGHAEFVWLQKQIPFGNDKDGWTVGVTTDTNKGWAFTSPTLTYQRT